MFINAVGHEYCVLARLDHHKNGTNYLLSRHAVIRVGIWHYSLTVLN